MKYEKTKEGCYEIYVPGFREWSSIDCFKQFLKQFQKIFSFFEEGNYQVYVTTNQMGTLFQIEKKTSYLFKKEVDLQITTSFLPFYLKSSMASPFKGSCFYFQNYFYGKSSDLVEDSMIVYEQVERISKVEYDTAQQMGIHIKKRREISSL